MARRVGPVLAGLLTLGALGGAVVAERTAVFPRAAAAVAPAGFDAAGCARQLGAFSPGAGSDLADTLVPVAAVSTSVCRYANGSAESGSIRLDALATAQLAAELDALAPSADTSQQPVGLPLWALVFHYGTRPDVTVHCEGSTASNGLRTADLSPEISAYLHRLTAG